MQKTYIFMPRKGSESVSAGFTIGYFFVLLGPKAAMLLLVLSKKYLRPALQNWMKYHSRMIFRNK